jgi:hypothetical protein
MQKINVNTVPDHSIIYIKGVVDFSHIIQRIEGAALEAENARMRQNGFLGDSKPFSRLAISQAAVDCADPASPTTGERFISERLYRSNFNSDKNLMYNAVNKSRSLPDVYIRDPASTVHAHAGCPREGAGGWHEGHARDKGIPYKT